MTYNTISQNNDDHFYTAVCAYVSGERNGIVPGTVGEEQAAIAKRLLGDNPAILDDKDRLLAEIATIHYRESGIEAREAYWVEMDKEHDEDLFANLVAYVRVSPTRSHQVQSVRRGPSMRSSLPPKIRPLARPEASARRSRLVAGRGRLLEPPGMVAGP